jgi:hypothetical protein
MLFLACAINIFAQEKEKPQPPPPRLNLPDDSTGTAEREKQEGEEKTAERLQLPDVLIYGKDTEVRILGEKMTVSPDRLLLEPLSEEDLRAGGPAELAGSKAARHEEAAPPNNFRADLAGGSFGQFTLGAFARFIRAPSGNQPDTRMELSADFDFNRADGQFDNSDFRNWRFEATGGYTWGEASSAQLKIGGGNRRYGFYGATNPNLDGDVGNFFAAALARLSAGSSAEFTLGGDLQFNGYDYLHDGAGVNVNVVTEPVEVDERVSAFRAGFEKRFSRAAIQINLETLRDRLEFPADSTASPSTKLRASNSRSQLSGDVRFPVGRVFTFTAGAQWSRAQRDDATQKSRFGPLLRIVAAPRQRLAFSAEFSNGWRYATLSTRWAENYYLDALTTFFPEEVTADWTIAAEYRLVRGWLLKAQYSRTSVRGLNYYERDAASGLVAVRQIEKATLSDLSVGIEMNFSEQLTLSGALHFLDDDIDDPRVTAITDVPYRGEVWLPARLEYVPVPKITVMTEARLVGSRRAALLNDSSLDGYLDLRARGEWRVLDKLTLYAEARNLLDDNFQRWEGYREMGLNVLAGLTAAW